jgi:hypothetical protein
MKSKTARFVLAAACLLAFTRVGAAQGTAGGTGAIASIPGSVVRGHEQGPGLVDIIAGSTVPNARLNTKRRTARPIEVEGPSGRIGNRH